MPVGAVISAVEGLLVLAVVSVLMARSARSGELQPNSLMGVRTGATTHCDECWRLGHQAAEPGLRRPGWVGAWPRWWARCRPWWCPAGRGARR